MADSKTTISITVTKEKLRELVVNHLQTLVNVDFDPKKVVIETRSKQNYKSEWENADFRASTKLGKTERRRKFKTYRIWYKRCYARWRDRRAMIQFWIP